MALTPLSSFVSFFLIFLPPPLSAAYVICERSLMQVEYSICQLITAVLLHGNLFSLIWIIYYRTEVEDYRQTGQTARRFRCRIRLRCPSEEAEAEGKGKATAARWSR